MSLRSAKRFVYDAASFDVTTGTTNYDVKTEQTSLFKDITVPTIVRLITDQTITIRLNSATAPAITMTSSESPGAEIFDHLKVNNIFITNNSGATANIEIRLFAE